MTRPASLGRAVALAAAAGAVAQGLGRALTPRPTRWLLLGGRRIALTESGRGPVVLFLHGLGGQAGNFHLVPPLLPDFRCVAIDRPGTGWSDAAAPGAAGITGHAASAAAVIEALGGGPALVVGHSLGGAIGLRLALDRPDLVAGLTGIGAMAGPELAAPARLTAALARRPLLREAVAQLLTAPLTPLLGPWSTHLAFTPERIPPGFARPGGLLAGLSPRMFSGLMRDLEVVAQGTPALRADLPGLTRPVLLVHGTEDHVLPHPRHALPAARAIPGAGLWLAQGGHMLPATQPGLVAAAIREVAARAGLTA